MPAENYEATGRRKTSVARVRMQLGDGSIYMNGRTVGEYLRRDSLEMILVQPLDLTETRHTFDIHISTRGGGLRGQAGCREFGHCPRLGAVRPAKAGSVEKGRLSDARCPRERAQKVRIGGRAQALPILQALVLFQYTRFPMHGRECPVGVRCPRGFCV